MKKGLVKGLGVALFVLSGCSSAPADGSPIPDTGAFYDAGDLYTEDPGFDLPPPEPTPVGAISGRIVNRDGEGLPALTMLCCTTSLCISGETEADGTYLFEELEIEARKMQVVDLSGIYMESLFYQEVVADETTALGRDVVMPPDEAEPQHWSADDGGEVSLAQGVLRLTAQPASLIYPFGFTDDMIRGLQIPASEIPPQNEEPWLGYEEESIAFLMNPVDVRSKEPLSLKIQDGGDRAVGAQFSVWSFNSSKGKMEMVGVATVQDDQTLLGDPDLVLTRVTLLVLIPTPTENQDAE